MKITENWSKDVEGQLLTFDFGKNGKGITDELILIAKRIEELSKDNCVYLHHESFIDTADDVYELKFVLIPKSEPNHEKEMQESTPNDNHLFENPLEANLEENAPERLFYDLDLVSPIRIIDNGNGDFMIIDDKDSEHFFYRTKTGKLVYDGFCINAENKEIVFDPLKASPDQLDVVLKNQPIKSLHNTTANGAKKNVKDIQFWGDGDTFLLISKASSEAEGWMKSTKAMPVGTSVVIQVTTQQRNPDGSYSVAEALTTVDKVIVKEFLNPDDSVNARAIVNRTWEHEGVRISRVKNVKIQNQEQ
jgi:hypothetical protein